MLLVFKVQDGGTARPRLGLLETAVTDDGPGILHRLGPVVDRLGGGAHGVDQLLDEPQCALAEVRPKLIQRHLLAGHAQVPPEPHEVTALLLVAVVGEPVVITRRT
ncbi:hypothetical protein [Streptomyces sp. NPDC012466]|uniref:hypothetical protein n=1 Tax=Streptomyces sp. NPDC012466 TaxID=3364835 RepID=UPI0036E955BD